MKIRINSPIRFILLIFFITALFLAACTREAELLPRVWIDQPRENLRVPSDQPLIIYSHAYAEAGLAEVVLSVDGVAYLRNQPSETGDDFAAFEQEWLPPGEGTYTLQVVAYDAEGVTSNPATLTITVGEPLEVVQVAEEPEPPTEVPEAPVVPTCPPLATVKTGANCRSGPGEEYPVVSSLPSGTEAAVVGGSQDGYWWVIDPPGGGSSCWIWEELVDLSNENCEVALVEAPPPPQDLTPPPAPEPAVPANGLSLSCRANQTLAWIPVQDESGIAGYRLKLEREASPGNWQDVNTYNQIEGKQIQIQVDCGLRYRWSVRAEDGAGNLSPWSAYASFAVELE